jgi:acyl-CoA thioester hydrolase
MEEYVRPVQIRWSDLDPNFHLRHSVYYDWGALCRIDFLYEHRLNAELMQELKIGPVLFREECSFRREIRMGDEITINLKLVKAKKDFSRWSIQHHILKNKDILSAVLTVDGAWLNIVERKLASPPQMVHDVFDAMPKDEAFQWM